MPETQWPVTDESVRDARLLRIATALETIAALLLAHLQLAEFGQREAAQIDPLDVLGDAHVKLGELQYLVGDD